MFEVGLLTWLIGLIGILIRSRNLVDLLLSIELMLSGLILSFLSVSLEIDDIGGIIFMLMILVLAAIESCIGLMSLVSYYQVSKSMKVFNLRVIKG